MLSSVQSKNAPFIDIPVGIALALSHAIIDTVRDPLLVLDQDQRITAASRSFYQTFKLAGQDLRGQVLFDIDGGQWNIPELRDLLQTIAKDQETIEGYEVDREFPVIGRRIMLLNVRKVFYEKGAHSTVLLAFEDVTDRRRVERQLEELMREKEMLLEEMQHRIANSLQIIASILLPGMNSYYLAFMAALLVQGILWGEYSGFLHHYHYETILGPCNIQDFGFNFVASAMLTVSLFLIVYFASSIAGRLRYYEDQMEDAYVNLQKLDEEKSFFMRKASHELRSPLAAIKASVSSLRSGAVGWNVEEIGRASCRERV